MLKIKKQNVEIFKKRNLFSEKFGGYLTYHSIVKIWRRYIPSISLGIYALGNNIYFKPIVRNKSNVLWQIELFQNIRAIFCK